MRLPFFLPIALAALTACQSGDQPMTARSKDDGVAQKLALGISAAEAEVALGMEAGFERNPQNYDESCSSYAYGDFGDGPRYVHARFRDGALVQRSDGHRGLCTYGSLIGG
ncbi:hypothetical protein J4E08_20830 [Sagittula sp. NFXS13]|uniref:Lipoprotein n=1 Tax=Sagittula marina TaxID=943940 RepID=A0A7W6DWJ8_9RHOB|nr:hypothetical protein [Sagittula marina]MBB3987960.1 hypothetical protein [Sagittula marina]